MDGAGTVEMVEMIRMMDISGQGENQTSPEMCQVFGDFEKLKIVVFDGFWKPNLEKLKIEKVRWATKKQNGRTLSNKNHGRLMTGCVCHGVLL